MSDASNSFGPGRALVTGAGGFIGRQLAECLVSSGREISALDLDLRPLESLATTGLCRLIQGDIGDASVRKRALDGVQTVFHLAATHLGTLHTAAQYHRVNVDATRSLAEECLAAGIERFVHCSTVGVYGRIQEPPADEDTPCRPELPYEKTKLEGERAVLDLATKKDLAAVVLRPVWVYGPDCRRTQKLFDAIARGRFVVAGKGGAFRHCIFIEDMVRALILAADAPRAPGNVFIIGDEEPITIRELVDQIAGLTASRPPVAVPLPALYLLAAVVEIVFRAARREPPLSRRSLRFFTANTAFRTDKARSLLGFEPRYDVSRGLTETHRQLESRQSADRHGVS